MTQVRSSHRGIAILRSVSLRALALVLLPVLTLGAESGAPDSAPEITYTSFRLENGLQVIVHEDHKAPIVAVNVWYHVGSKDERPGRTGFAHLYEHLMFNGSEHYDGDYFAPFEEIGATEMNGTTNSDRTNYFANVPATALDRALWLESDRMGHLLGAITQDKLDEQRRVVKNEKRQGENRPFGDAFELIAKSVFPMGHPYSWTPIGSMEDLDAASLEEVREWFKTYYGAANAVLVLAGDIDPTAARALAERYFADIPPGPPTTRPEVWIARRSGERRLQAQGNVPYGRLYLVWNVPEYASREADLLDLVASVVGEGSSSRLYRRLVLRDQLATSVNAYNWRREIAGLFMITIDARPDVDLARLESAAREELAAFLQDGPSAEELTRAKTTARASFLRGIERVGGFGGKSDVLAVNAVFADDPGYYRVIQRNIEAAQRKDVRDAARGWLGDGRFVLEYRPAPRYRAPATGVDRSQGMPGVPELPAPVFPAVQRGRLASGLGVVLAPRAGVPIVEIELQFDAGMAADRGAPLGVASFALDMIDEGTGKRDAAAIRAQLEQLGAELSVRTTLDTSSVVLSALQTNLDASLALLAELVRTPAFRDGDIERLREERVAAIRREVLEPEGLVQRTLPSLLFGVQHPYGAPLTGTGTVDAVRGLGRTDLLAFQQRWLRPDNAVLLAAGSTSFAALMPLVEKHFGTWTAPPLPIGSKEIPAAPAHDKPRIYLLDRPGAQQSLIVASLLGPATSDPADLAVSVVTDALGGAFTSRLNQNLREEKGWAYSASLRRSPAQGPTVLSAYAPVQTDRTGEAMKEILREYREMISSVPLADEEIGGIVRRRMRELPGRFETSRAVLRTLSDMARFDRPDDWVEASFARLAALQGEEVRESARSVLKPDQITWLIVGDLARIEMPIRKLELGSVAVLDVVVDAAQGE